MDTQVKVSREKLIAPMLGMSIIVLITTIITEITNTKIIFVLIVVQVLILIGMLIPKSKLKRLMNK